MRWEEPIAVGPMRLDHRLVVSPHSGGGGLLIGTDEQFEQHCAYWLARIQGGFQWIGGGPTFVGNLLIPGFEPTGVGANGPGVFRHPLFGPRLSELMARIHAAGGFGSVQMVIQGGSAVAPSNTLSGYNDHRIPHALSVDEIAWYVREYGESAAIAADAGADVIELHANHDDLLQWFLSPLTNRRDDAYGGDLEARRRFLREVVDSIRAHVRGPIAVGLRLNMDEGIEGGYGPEECSELLAAFTADGTIDYFSLDVGDNWGRLSYLPTTVYEEAAWAPLCGQVRTATDLPVVYVGRVTSVESAERVLADGHADLVGFARAAIADPDLVAKSRAGRPNEVRPCLGFNECIDRRVVENLPFACAANSLAGREGRPPIAAEVPFSALVVGGGPAGTELAALLAEQGHWVELWERDDRIGGQLAVAGRLRANARFGAWIDWQEGRLDRAGVLVRLGHEATVAEVVAHEAEVVAVATGAQPRGLAVPGAGLPFVVGAVDAVTGAAPIGRRVVLVSEDDRAAPLTIADHLAGLGHEITIVHQSLAPSPLVGKYTIGALLARLDAEQARLVPAARVVGFEPGVVHLANVYSGRRWSLEGVDTVVVVAGAEPDDALFQAVRTARPQVHVLGDAYAPRRMVFATRAAYELASALATAPHRAAAVAISARTPS